jgi:hypothetical protein
MTSPITDLDKVQVKSANTLNLAVACWKQYKNLLNLYASFGFAPREIDTETYPVCGIIEADREEATNEQSMLASAFLGALLR